MANTQELLPNAKLPLSSLRSVGYTEETAIADNGEGMKKDVLLESMKIGSSDPKKIRDSRDLGRFGMIMKTAVFSLTKNYM